MRTHRDSTVIKKLADLGRWILPPTDDPARLKFRRITLDVILVLALLAILVTLLAQWG